MKFTDRFVTTLRKPDERKVIWEDGEHGKGTLGLRLSPTGSKAWVYMYVDPRSKKARMATLGRYPSMSVAQAHEAHAKAVQAVERGEDPAAPLVEAKAAQRAAPTVEELVAEYLQKWARPNKKSWAKDERILQKNVLPEWRGIKAEQIGRRDVVKLIDQVMARGAPIMANRTLAVLRKMFNWAVERSILDHSPVDHVKPPAVERKKDRVLTEAEIRILWRALLFNEPEVSITASTRRALLFQLLTACRTEEVVGLTWGEIDGDWWTLPKERAKNKVEHRIPLSTNAQRILGKARENGGREYPFPSPRKTSEGMERAMESTSLTHAIKKILPKLELRPFTSHDLRRTAATNLAALGTPRLVVAKILNHVDQQVTAVYDRHTYDDEKRAALQAWSDRIDRIVAW